MDLRLDDDQLGSCVGCGLCLPHCPTFRVTGEEALSPRGRIAAMRQVQHEGAAVTEEFVDFMETCVQCRGCESACPSGVPFGRLMEGTRAELARRHRTAPRWQRLAYRVLGHHRLLLAGSSALAVGQRLRLIPARAGLPRLPIRRGPAVTGTGSTDAAQTPVWMFTGCVMDAWMRDTHRSTAAVLAAAGADVMVPGAGGSCCGALHEHAGLDRQTKRLARQVMASMPGDAPILVNSAGCGATLKDYGHVLGTDEAAAFAARVRDVHEWLADRVDRLPTPAAGAARPPVIIQDPCHLRHVQKAHLPVRTVLGRYARLVELDDDGLCCGAGGAYSALEPDLAGQIRDRKAEALHRAAASSGAKVVASANPGCAMHLAAAGFHVRHPMDLVAEAIR